MKIVNFLEGRLHDEVIHDGVGVCRHSTVYDASMMDAPVRFINYTKIPPNCSFGLHKHGNDNEFYIVLKGIGIYHEDGVDVAVKAGDVMMNAPYGTHGLDNIGDEDMELLVFEVAVTGA